ncbi:hypothetical protein PQR05_29540 [Paraburkholderia sediminicola]|uniref:hypothetical protein n=1 Tax=Paraburkholderia sediminicola TaxID=458836 RepID=UPI0038BBF233
MSGTQTPKYTVHDQREVENFVLGVAESEAKPGMLLDSTSAATAALTIMGSESGQKPRAIDELLGLTALPEEKIVKAIFDGVNAFEREHGFKPTGDLILSAIDQGRSIYDSATNNHHDQISLTPNAPIVAILGALAEACPFAGYLPADRGSNEARLIIVSHQAGSNWGGYKQGDLMDGIAQGQPFLGSARTQELAAPNDGAPLANYKFLFKEQSSGGNPIMLLRGRTIIYVNGMIAAQEIQNGSLTQASVSVAGGITIDGTDYSLSGTIKPGTGEVVVTPTPALPDGTVVSAEAFADYEADPTKTPKMMVQAQVFQLFASPFRVTYQVTPEARSQFSNEVGVDAGAEAMLAVRGQYAMERHYNALAKAKMIGKFNNHWTYDFDYDRQMEQKTRAQVWQDFAGVVGMASQKMAEDTADHGITHMYVGKFVAAQYRTLDATLFQSSGIADRPGIFRVGRLFGLYEVYYSPWVVNEAPDGSVSEILCVGRSTQTARCPIIMGDASAPMFEPLGTTETLKTGYGFNSRSFNAVNPHQMSALGCAVITVKNMTAKS